MSDTGIAGHQSADAVQQMRRAAAANDWACAGLLANGILKSDPNDLQSLFFASLADAALNRWDSASDHLDRLATLVPGMVEVQERRAQVARMRGDVSTMVASLTEVVASDPANIEARRRLVDVALVSGAPQAEDLLAASCRAVPFDDYLARIRRTLAGAAAARTATRGERLVALVSDGPRVREAKLAHAIKLAGWDVVLLYQHPPAYDPEVYFDRAFRYTDWWDAVAQTTALRPTACHVVAQMKYETVGALLAARPCPIVVDSYDNVGMLGEGFLSANPERRFDLALEESSFTRADGFVCRNLETQANVRRGNRTMRGNRLFFPEYCWGDAEVRPKLSQQDGHLHVVHGGSFWIEKQNPDAGGDGGMLWLAELFDRNRIHFHLYPSGPTPDTFDELLSDYRDFEARSPYFHLHRPIADNRHFIREVSAYDIGLMVLRSPLRKGGVWQYDDQKYAYCYGNKLADFVDAGLHVLTLPGFNLFHYLLRHMGLDIAATPDMFDERYWQDVKERVLSGGADFKSAQDRFSLQAHARRLTAFYERMAGEAR